MKLFAVGLAALVALLAGPTPAAAAASHALIQGSGSSWAANAVNQWVADVANQGLQVVFTANGSGQGRKDYANRTTDFGVSDIPFGAVRDPGTHETDDSQGRSFAYLPIAAGGTAFPYHIDVGRTRVRNLRLSGQTVAKIFTGQITNWNDPAVTHDNNGHALPSLPIIPVVHAEAAGVSGQFSRYLSKQFPSIWKACNGSADETEYFPVNCGKARGNEKAFTGSDGVMNFIKSAGANGSIGLEEYSYPLLSGFPSAKLLNAAGYYTLPTQYNVAVALTKAKINQDPSSPNYLIQNLDSVYTNPDRRTYALSSYVYAIIPTASDDSRMSTAKRQTLADFLYYSICQGQQEIGPIGYSSLPINLVEAGFDQIGKLKKADPKVDLNRRNVSTCHNPTFIAGQPQVNHLAVIAPQPAACDRSGAGPCDANQGTYNANPGGSGGTAGNGSGNGSGHSGTGGGGSGRGGTGGAGGTSGPGGTGASTAGPGATPGATATSGPAAGGGNGALGLSLTDGGDGTAAGGDAAPVATTLAADQGQSGNWPLLVLAVGLFIGALATPIGVRTWLARRGGSA